VELASSDESRAIERSQRGDANAFGSLVERYQEAAFRTAYLVTHDAAAAEDVAQEAFVRAYRELHRFHKGDPFRPWLLRIVHNLALNEVRSRKRRSAVAERVAVAAPAAEPPADAGLAGRDEAAAVLRAIGELDADDRQILHLRWFLELPEAEIAVAIGRPAGTVKSRLHRAGQRLRAVIEQKYPELREYADG
jgi:RNA polymerase sigma-70 factor (ECF subfamily)